MVITIAYPATGIVRRYSGLTQAEINRMISHVSNLQDTVGEVVVKITVK